ncbi:MAG: FAD-dependent oxidoreductase [Candidatus Zixiibacteriota bacterium]|jgi:heterodisulfide reductase subunit A
MMDVGRHPNVELLTLSELVGLRGTPGNFVATVRRYPRYVDEDECVGCGDCEEVCPMVAPSFYEHGLGARKAIFRPFPQAVPAAYMIDRDACLNEETFLACSNCATACKRDAVDFDQRVRDEEIEVGAVIVATGFDEFDPRVMRNYGYGIYENVMTSLEFERMLSASGPTRGHIVRPTDRKAPKRIVYVQCVGARGEGGQHFCSRFCCMNAVKDAMLAKIHDPNVESMTILYTDLRAFGKGFEQFVDRSREVDEIHYVRGRPSKITGAEDGTMTVYAEDTLDGKRVQLEADLVVLSVAARPNETTRDLAEALGIELDRYGFIRKRDPDSFYLETTRDGVYLCGSAGGPQVIPDCVAQASGAAALAAKHVAELRVPDEVVDVEQIDPSGEPRIGVFVCHCGANIAGLLDIGNLVEYASTLDGVVYASDELFACSDTSQRVIQDAIIEHNLNRLVVAACTPRTHEPVFRKACEAVGLNAYLFEMVNIRDQCSWVHVGEPEAALDRARDQIGMAVARARKLEPLNMIDVPVESAALVVGGGVAGLQAALEIARQGFKTTIIEKTDKLGGRLNRPSLTKLYPSGRDADKLIAEKIAQLDDAGVEVLLNTEVARVDGFVGNFEVELADASGKKKGQTRKLRVGAIVLAVGAGLYDPKGEYHYGEFPNVITSLGLEQNFAEHGGRAVVEGQQPDSVAFIQCVGSRCEEGNPGCSRYCCPTTIKQALMLREHGADVTVFYKDIRTVSDGAEEMYRTARGKGVLFIKIAEDDRAEVVADASGKVAGAVEAYDILLKSRVRAPADLVVLSTGMVPREPDTTILQSIFKIPRGDDKFLMERHPELGPVETTTDGVFIVGCLQAPKDIADSLSQASAAAAKVARLLARDTVKLEPVIATVDETLCRGCGQCADICQFNAPELVQLKSGVYVARINEAVCKGCGTCAVWCPTGAIVARHFTDLQIHTMLETVLPPAGKK